MLDLSRQDSARKKIKFILSLFNNKFFFNKSVLDVGSGTGNIGASLFQMGASVTALDIDDSCLKFINKNYPQIKTIKQNLDKNFKINKRHDIVTHIGTLNCLQSWREHLINICQITKDILILECSVFDSDDENLEVKFKEENLSINESCNKIESRTTSAAIEKIFKENGFSFYRFDSEELNYKNNIYNWKVKNTGEKDSSLRRFWVCSKRSFIIENFNKKYFKPINETQEYFDKQVEVDNKLEKEALNVKFNKIEHKEASIQLNKIESVKTNTESNKIINNYILDFKPNIIEKDISIIIPTYKNTQFINECIWSIKNQKFDDKIEILLGVDNCQETLAHIENNYQLFKDIKIFWFEKNVGPYIVKNSLIDSASYENILFFDSDDIMMENFIKETVDGLQNKPLVRYKFYNFYDGKDIKNNKNLKNINIYAAGIMGIRKNTFLKHNGFENWTCAADAEFLNRMDFYQEKTHFINKPMFYRRLHGNNLEFSSKTDAKSEIRKKYHNLINLKKSSNKWSVNNKITEKFELKKIIQIEKKDLIKNIDACIIISSYNRKEKLKHILNKLYNQKSKYSFKIILLNDGSEENYEEFKNYNLDYLENKINNGKFKYWESITKLFTKSSSYNYKYLIQIDDDFNLIDNFLEKIIDFYLENKNKDSKIIGMHYHLTKDKLEKRWGLEHWVDGGCMFDVELIKNINYKIDPISMLTWKKDPTRGSGVWQQISKKICQLNYKIIRPEISYASHDGNFDSKMNKNIRSSIPIITSINNKDFNLELDLFINKINNKENFVLTRYGDGELLIIKNMIVGSGTQAKKVDKWDFNGQKTICQDLNETLNNNYNNYYYGIPCPCCNLWATEEYRKLLKFDFDNLTYANIFVNGNYQKWFKYVQTILESCIVIVNANGKNNQISKIAKEIHYVEDDCANWYESEKNNILNYYLNIANNNNNETFLISAGPLSEILIHKMYNANSNNRYIDVGSSLDTLIHGKTTRKYHIENSARANQVCKWTI